MKMFLKVFFWIGDAVLGLGLMLVIIAAIGTGSSSQEFIKESQETIETLFTYGLIMAFYGSATGQISKIFQSWPRWESMVNNKRANTFRRFLRKRGYEEKYIDFCRLIVKVRYELWRY